MLKGLADLVLIKVYQANTIILALSLSVILEGKATCRLHRKQLHENKPIKSHWVTLLPLAFG
jgi:hypothetical protein